MNDFACFECGRIHYGNENRSSPMCCGKSTSDARSAMSTILAEIVALKKEVKALKEAKDGAQ